MRAIALTFSLLLLARSSEGWSLPWSSETDLCNNLCRCPSDLHEARETGLDCRDNGISKLPDEIVIPKEISRIDFSRNHITEITTSAFKETDTVSYLDFSDNDIESLAARAFEELPELKTLIFKNNKLTALDVEAFAGLTNLTLLDLSYNQLQSLPGGVFADLAKLQELILDFNPLVKLDLNLIANNSKLRSLSLSQVGIETLHADFFPESLKKLEKLSLAYNEINIIPTKALHRLRNSLRELDLSGNPIQVLGAYSFYGLANVRTLRMDQMLKLETIDAFAFGDLNNLETCILRYMPKIVSVDAKAFRSGKNKTEITVPVKDFTFSFSILSTLPETLLDWKELRQVDIQYNHWNCDCDMKWVKSSPLLELVGNRMICSRPNSLRGHRIKNIPEEKFTCEPEQEPIAKHESVGFLIGLMIAGIGVSLGTVALLVYWRQGWLCRRPNIPYTNFDRGSTAMTVVDNDLEWDSKDLEKD